MIAITITFSEQLYHHLGKEVTFKLMELLDFGSDMGKLITVMNGL